MSQRSAAPSLKGLIRDWAWRQVMPAPRKAVFMFLVERFNVDWGYACPSKGDIAKHAGVTSRQVFNHLKKLEESGLVEISQVPYSTGFYRSNRYFLRVPADAVEAAEVVRDDAADDTPAAPLPPLDGDSRRSSAFFGGPRGGARVSARPPEMQRAALGEEAYFTPSGNVLPLEMQSASTGDEARFMAGMKPLATKPLEEPLGEPEGEPKGEPEDEKASSRAARGRAPASQETRSPSPNARARSKRVEPTSATDMVTGPVKADGEGTPRPNRSVSANGPLAAAAAVDVVDPTPMLKVRALEKAAGHFQSKGLEVPPHIQEGLAAARASAAALQAVTT